jgi:hypothetical protein
MHCGRSSLQASQNAECGFPACFIRKHGVKSPAIAAMQPPGMSLQIDDCHRTCRYIAQAILIPQLT